MRGMEGRGRLKGGKMKGMGRRERMKGRKEDEGGG